MWSFKKKIRTRKPEYPFPLPLERQPEPDPLDEIEVLFDKIKESDLLQSNVVEHNEIVSSRLVMAYYLCKLERKIR